MVSSVVDYLDVTELAGDPISAEQLDRMVHRYYWAAGFCRNKDVAELACGTGPGLGLLAADARSLESGDVSEPMLDRVRAHYGSRVSLQKFDALKMPYADASKDVLVIFEAIYYLSSIHVFVAECRRVLRPGGYLLVATANKDLPDFNPSAYVNRYLGTCEMMQEFGVLGSVELFGYLDTSELSLRQRLLRPVKKLVVSLGLMPKTMGGKRILKRLVFGRPVRMPSEISGDGINFHPPRRISGDDPDQRHKVIYCSVMVS